MRLGMWGFLMKKNIYILLLMISAVILFSACGEPQKAKNDSGKINVISTLAPACDWVSEIAGEKAELFNIKLLSNGGDLHGFQPSARDIAEIRESDILITLGGISDIWSEKLDGLDRVKELKLMDILDEEKLIIPDEEDENHHNHMHSKTEYDEHIWLSVKLAKMQVDGICEALCDIDPQNGIIYRRNAADYCEKLDLLDKRYQEAAQGSKDKIVIFADRFPFSYLMKDYGVISHSAFQGCSTDSDASFETVVRLAEQVTACDKKTILILENSNHTVADSIIAAVPECDFELEVMDSCQTVTSENVKEFDYLQVMEKNLEALTKALN